MCRSHTLAGKALLTLPLHPVLRLIDAVQPGYESDSVTNRVSKVIILSAVVHQLQYLKHFVEKLQYMKLLPPVCGNTYNAVTVRDKVDACLCSISLTRSLTHANRTDNHSVAEAAPRNQEQLLPWKMTHSLGTQRHSFPPWEKLLLVTRSSFSHQK
jgi:hypothetical protein